MVDGLAVKGRALEARDGRDVEDGAPPPRPHAVAEDRVGGGDEAVDVGARHLLDLVDGEFPEAGGGAEGEAGLAVG